MYSCVLIFKLVTSGGLRIHESPSNSILRHLISKIFSSRIWSFSSTVKVQATHSLLMQACSYHLQCALKSQDTQHYLVPSERFSIYQTRIIYIFMFLMCLVNKYMKTWELPIVKWSSECCVLLKWLYWEIWCFHKNW